MARGIYRALCCPISKPMKGNPMDFSFPVKRTPEQGHTAPCMAKALISAIENARDLAISEAHGSESAAQFDFRSMAQDNIPLQWADGYLADGTAECICPALPCPICGAALSEGPICTNQWRSTHFA